MAEIRGVDYAWTHPDPQRLFASGVRFVMRYLSHDPSKDLSAGELAALHAAGLGVGVVWETTATRALEGYAAGRQDAREARVRLHGLGFPDKQPCYFADDWDTTGAAVASYFQGAGDAIGVARVGCYAGIGPVSFLFDHKLIRYGWQTYAWSGGLWDPRAQIRQVQNHASLDDDVRVRQPAGIWWPPKTKRKPRAGKSVPPGGMPHA